MKRRVLMIAVMTATAALLLTACMSSEQVETANTTPGSMTSDTVSGTSDAASSDPQSGTQSGTAEDSQTWQSDESSSTAGVAGSTAGAADGSSLETEELQISAVQEMGAASGEDDNSPEDDSGSDAESPSDIWTGVYVTDEETLTITKEAEYTISFSFAQVGIAGSASFEGNQAVYNGDDHYVIIFNKSDTIVNVEVSSEEDYDASGSPLIGTYVKQSR